MIEIFIFSRHVAIMHCASIRKLKMSAKKQKMQMQMSHFLTDSISILAIRCLMKRILWPAILNLQTALRINFALPPFIILEIIMKMQLRSTRIFCLRNEISMLSMSTLPFAITNLIIMMSHLKFQLFISAFILTQSQVLILRHAIITSFIMVKPLKQS